MQGNGCWIRLKWTGLDPETACARTTALANAIVHLAVGYVSSVSVDLAFIVEAQAEEELPEKLLGNVRIQQIEMSSAIHVHNVSADHNCGGDNCGRLTGVNNGEWRKRGRRLKSHGSRVRRRGKSCFGSRGGSLIFYNNPGEIRCYLSQSSRTLVIWLKLFKWQVTRGKMNE